MWSVVVGTFGRLELGRRGLVAQVRGPPLHQLVFHGDLLRCGRVRVRRGPPFHQTRVRRSSEESTKASDQIMISNPAAERRANAETPRQGVALRGPAAASDYYELLPHGPASVGR